MAEERNLAALFEGGHFNRDKFEGGTLTLRFTPDKTQLVMIWIPDDVARETLRQVFQLTDGDNGGDAGGKTYWRCVNKKLTPNSTFGDILAAMVSCIGQ